MANQSDKDNKKSKKYTSQEFSDLKNLQNLHRFVLSKKFQGEKHSEEEWEEILKEHKI